MPPPFRASQIGSLIRPTALTDARKTNSPDLPQLIHSSIRSALASQLSFSFSPLSNGEFPRTVFWDGLFESLSGLTPTTLPVPTDLSAQHAFRKGHPTLPLMQKFGIKEFTCYIATSKIRWTKPAYLDEWEGIKTALAELAHSPEEAARLQGQVKMSIPALTREHFLLAEGRAWTAESGYTSSKAYLADLAAAWREEIRVLYDAGLRHLQIDDPQLTFFVDEGLRGAMESDGFDAEGLLGLYVWAANEYLRDLPADLHVGMHLCRGNTPGGGHMTEGSYEVIAKALFVEMRYETLYLEYDTERAGGFEPLRYVPRGKNVVLGVVSTKTDTLENIEELEKRVRGAAATIAEAQGRTEEEVLREQIGISPQCGFASSSAGGMMTEEGQWKKLQLVQELARRLWPDEVIDLVSEGSSLVLFYLISIHVRGLILKAAKRKLDSIELRKYQGLIALSNLRQNNYLTGYQRITGDLLPHLEKFTDVPGIYKLDEQTIVKTGNATSMAEAAALRLVREQTSIPVPEVFDAYMRDDDAECGAIIMEYVQGDVLRDIWPQMTQTEKDSIVDQLRDYMIQLREISSDFIGSVDKTPCRDQFFSEEPDMFGPFESEGDFRAGCIRAMYNSRHSHWTETVAGFIKALPPAKIVLTHNDFHPRNIIVRDGKVVGIIDWELCGFYPEYWEYVKGWYRVDIDNSWVQERAIDKILTPFPLARAVFEHTRDIIW
ncbi:UROD/MetE-like protein [Pseudovirgaria hyperparasitica]|uniref:UROD/MetE-like protein n=1 Tax=Pseudovirgaria hyperparasitica TaxID=470096 RepID=A0A6A6WLX6_9PEZI|nr:UROD/MetE-like protein [Pseudovirgaria hyperparasitica]KAF2763201.1 UROD/MetE-like protein [Pseudovirgaria hyperparasitica]